MTGNKLLDFALSVALSTMGGVTRVLVRSSKINAVKMLAESFAAIFTGCCVFLSADALVPGSYNARNQIIAAACGLAGWLGTRALDMLTKIGTKKLGLPEDAVPPDSHDNPAPPTA